MPWSLEAIRRRGGQFLAVVLTDRGERREESLQDFVAGLDCRQWVNPKEELNDVRRMHIELAGAN